MYQYLHSKDYKDIANSIFNSLGASLIGWFSFCGAALSTFIQWHLKNIKRPFVLLSSIVHDVVVVYLSVQVCLRIRANSSTTIRMDRKKGEKLDLFSFISVIVALGRICFRKQIKEHSFNEIAKSRFHVLMKNLFQELRHTFQICHMISIGSN